MLTAVCLKLHIRSQRLHKLRMTLDYLDFSVEHLSKWWKMLDWHQYPIVYDSITSKLARYITYEDEFPTPDDPVLKTTVATIAFQPYSIPSNFAKKKGYDFETWQERAHNLTVLSMAATIESLRRAEMGRVVIAGSLDMHEKYAQDSFRYLVDNLKNQKHETKGDKVTKVGHMEVGFTVMDAAQTKTKHLERNMPKGVLVGAREAFVAADLNPSKRTVNQTKNLIEWFGDDQDPKYWQYLYLTEPDSILQTRTTSLKQLKAEVDSGGILSPFRLQPIPHESDLRGLEARSLYLNEADGFEEVIELDQYNNHDVCCDEHKGPDFRPGMEGKDEECGKGTKWFMCGFVPEGKKRENPHKRLKLYKLIRLAKGTGLTTIAGNLFARRCQPAKNSVCTPPSYVKR